MVFEKHEVYLKRIVMCYGLAFRMIWLQNVDQTPIGRDTGSNFRFTYYWICLGNFTSFEIRGSAVPKAPADKSLS